MRHDKIGWFDFDPDIDRRQEPTEAQALFLAGLRRRAESWGPRSEPDDTSAEFPSALHPDLLVTLGIHDPERRWGGLIAGVHFDGAGIRCDEAPYPNSALADPRTPLARDATGTPAESAEQAADWFEWMLRRPIDLHQWLHEGDVFAWACLITDPKHDLNQVYLHQQAPPGRQSFPVRTPDRVIHFG